MSNQSPRNDENPYKHIRQKSNDDWYFYWLCEDKDFLADLEKLWGLAGSHLHGIRTKRDEGKLSTLLWQDVLKKYHLTDDELERISMGLHLQIPLDFPLKIEAIGDDRVTFSMPKNILKKDYEAAYDYLKEINVIKLEQNGKPLNRNRAADDTKLIYAIFKARNKKLSFREIFLIYQRGELECYENGPTNQFSSEDSLESYYNRYKPIR